MKQQPLEVNDSSFTASHRAQKRAAVRGLQHWSRRVGLPYLFLLPFLFLFLLFFIVPLGYALWISLFADRLVGGSVFVGLQNYVHAFQDSNFWEGVRRTALLLVIQVPVMLALAMIFALLLDSSFVRLRTLFRLGFFLPYAIPSVVSALLWGYLYSPSFGPLTQVASALHLPAPGFLTASGLLASIGNIVTWQYTGYNMIVIYAALQAVPAELYDAARVDGATGWSIARYIKIPLITPALVLTGIFSIIGTLQLFNEPQILSTLVPNVIQDHYTPNLYAYTLAFTNQQYNYSAAISFALGAIVFVGSYIFMFATNQRSLR
ncbi:MAG TPA: sugar ABC transporter permease [Ktedonobacteraceae bacterium]|jgi:multiple sugar transport system permease protein